MIVLDNIVKLFQHEQVRTTALNQISLTINKGEFIAVTGPSGCGKSTLLNVVGLLSPFDKGQYSINNTVIDKLTEKQRSKIRANKISFIFQNFNLIDDLTVYKNIELPLIYQNVGTSERHKRVTEVLAKTDISHRANHFPSQLSGGQQQRVAIARAIITSPTIILADEPTGNLDSNHRKEVMDLLAELNNSGTTVMMVTHSEADAKYASRVIQMNDGKVIVQNDKAA
jgi:putative ABC transport system ATP-binding protein